MPVCVICGHTKPTDQFYYVRRFKTFKPRDAQWCQDCQKMFIHMKEQEQKKKFFEDKQFNGLVEFKWTFLSFAIYGISIKRGVGPGPWRNLKLIIV